MMKRFLAALLLIASILMFTACQPSSAKKEYPLITTMIIAGISDKFIDDQPYITIVLEDQTAAEYGLNSNMYTIAIEQELYDQVDLAADYIGVTIRASMTDELKAGNLGSALFVMLNENDLDTMKIIGLSKG